MELSKDNVRFPFEIVNLLNKQWLNNTRRRFVDMIGTAILANGHHVRMTCRTNACSAWCTLWFIDLLNTLVRG